MKEKNISDDEIEILGQNLIREETGPSQGEVSQSMEDEEKNLLQDKDLSQKAHDELAPEDWQKKFLHRIEKLIYKILAGVGVIILIVFLIVTMVNKSQKDEYQSVSLNMDIKPEASEDIKTDTVPEYKTTPEFKAAPGYINVRRDTVNDVPLTVYIPYNAVPELTLTMPGESDSTVVFIAQAADVGANNFGIVGDFVLSGERLVRGISKKGFCAIINRVLTIGVADETPLLQSAIDGKGYFFRQYPLVKNGEPIDNKPKGKAIRRALAIRDGQVMMIESGERESFHDFAQALADAGISDAIYLVGSVAYGWYVDEQGKQTTFGVKSETQLSGVNYLVWRRETLHNEQQ
ncbi:MAG: hypothetical protein LBE91_08410 [Tannerella sp.]|jgi:hypothetical protein|nr:hypothetical protein [Tannerella sp.]